MTTETCMKYPTVSYMFVRPKMKVQGLWMQSVGLLLFVADVDVAHDSSLTVEAGGVTPKV